MGGMGTRDEREEDVPKAEGRRLYKVATVRYCTWENLIKIYESMQKNEVHSFFSTFIFMSLDININLGF